MPEESDRAFQRKWLGEKIPESVAVGVTAADSRYGAQRKWSKNLRVYELFVEGCCWAKGKASSTGSVVTSGVCYEPNRAGLEAVNEQGLSCLGLDCSGSLPLGLVV
jgi:hypothetical protein